MEILYTNPYIFCGQNQLLRKSIKDQMTNIKYDILLHTEILTVLANKYNLKQMAPKTRERIPVFIGTTMPNNNKKAIPALNKIRTIGITCKHLSIALIFECLMADILNKILNGH